MDMTKSILAAAGLTVMVPSAASAQAATVTAAPGKGVTVDAGDAFSTRLRGRIQLRGAADLPEASPAQSVVSVGTARLVLDGHLYSPALGYTLQLALGEREFREATRSPVLDAFVTWRAHRDLQVRAGQFFVPFDRLRTIRDGALQLADRARPVTELALDRDVGLEVSSEALGGDRSPVGYHIGVFGGGGVHNVTPRDAGGLLVARLELRPFGPLDDDADSDLTRTPSPRLAVGVGGARNFSTNRTRSTTGPSFALGTVDYTHAVADAVFKWAGFAAQGEWLWRGASVDTLKGSDASGQRASEGTRAGWGYVGQASYLFERPFEVVGRYARLKAEDDAAAAFVSDTRDRGQELTAGLNYYAQGHALKVQTAWTARSAPGLKLDDADHTAQIALDASF